MSQSSKADILGGLYLCFLKKISFEREKERTSRGRGTGRTRAERGG